MNNLKSVNKETIIKDAKEKISTYEQQKEVFNIVVEELKKFDGKNITKRIATKVEKVLQEKFNTDFKVNYNTDYGFRTISVYNHKIECFNFNNRNNIYLENKENIFNFELMINKSRWLTNFDKRIEEIKEDINLIESTDIIEKFNNAIQTIKTTKDSFKSGIKYDITR